MKKQMFLDDKESEKNLRELLDSLHRAEQAAAQREYTLKMERIFSKCPGFIEANVPQGESWRGSVVIDPMFMQEGVQWLKRRYIVAPSLIIDGAAGGLRIEIAPRPKHHGPRKQKVEIRWGKPEQFELDI